MQSHSKRLPVAFAIGLLLVLTNLTVEADVLWFMGNPTPISGKVVTESDTKIEFQVFADERFGATQTYNKDQVEAVVANYDTLRLEDLSPTTPAAYREYAEELGAQVKDASAIDLARRLYLLAAMNSQGEMRSEAIRGLASLARTEQERYRFELLRHLNDPRSGNIELVSPVADDSIRTEPEKAMMLRLVRAIRREEFGEAFAILKSEENRQAIRKWNDVCTLEEIERIAGVNRPSKLQLSKLLSIESMVRSDSVNVSNKKLKWGDLATQPSSSLGVLPTLANATRFDPKRTIYRDGKWIKPSQR